MGVAAVPSDAHQVAPPAKRSRRLRRAALVAATIAALLALAWTAREPLLVAAAEAWTLSDELRPADAIVVLGGSLETRPFVAAELYKRGLARRILVANARPNASEKLGVVARHVEFNRAVLAKLGVPAEAVSLFGDEVANTYEEARALRQWVASTGAKHIIVPTEIFQTRRTRWIIGRELATAGADVSVHAITPRDFDCSNWWRHELGVISFQNEVLKYAYYRFKYRSLMPL
jgi:uncharacterized SAM-binding protein YcdF (DUF218 family)